MYKILNFESILKSNREMRKSAVILFIVFLLTALILFPIGLNRYVDVDEGFYLYSADLVLHGQTPYTDFYYPQMPLLPYIFAGWLAVFGIGWISARIFAVLLCAFIADLLFYWVYRETKQFRWAVLAVILFVLNSLTPYGLLTAKTFTVTVVTSLLALILITDSSPKYGILKSGFAGFLAGLCFGSRLLAAPIILIVIAVALFNNFEEKWRRLLACSTGIMLSLIPVFILFFKDPAIFWFNNVSFHSLRHAGRPSLIGDFQQKAKLILGMLGCIYTKGGIGAQFLLLFVPFIGVFSRWKRLSLSEIAAFFFALSMLLVSLLPTPVYHVYFVVPLPFVIFVATLHLAKIYPSRSHAKFQLDLTWKWLIMILVLYLLLGVPNMFYYLGFYKTTKNFFSVDGVKFVYKKDMNIKRIQEVSNYLRDNTNPNDYVLSFWSGYLFGINRKAYPGTENHVIIWWMGNFSKYLSPKEVKKYRLVNSSDLQLIIKERKVPTIVFAEGETSWSFPATARKHWMFLINEAGYKAKKQFGRIVIYQLS